MTESEQKAVMTLALMAAFADGTNDPTERAEVARIAESLSRGSSLNTAALYQDVLMKRVTAADAVGALTTPDVKRLAYELAVGVCCADGAENDAERAFLASLKASFGFDAATSEAAAAFTNEAEALATAPLSRVSTSEPATLGSSMGAEEQDRLILNYAILNGALELLPDSLATMAIVPLQMKMVYRIGRSYGIELDRAHIKEFAATAGVGMASQFVEQVGVRLAGAMGKMLGGRMLGGLLGGVAGQSVSSGFSFATTYALGRLAVRYYSGGRAFSAQVLKDTYAALLRDAQGIQGQYLPAIQERARTVDIGQLLQDIRR